MFDFEPTITSPESPPIIQSLHLLIFGPDFDESKINLTIKYPKVQTPSSPDLGNVLTDFDSESKRCLEIVMTFSILLQTLLQLIQHGKPIEAG